MFSSRFNFSGKFPKLFALSVLLSSASCADVPLSPDVERGQRYDREFVKAMGVPATGRSWSEARSKVITVKTSVSTAVRVFAEIGGERFLFASLGNVCGATPIMVNVPAEVETLIVSANGSEYAVRPGQVVDLQQNITPPNSRSAQTYRAGKLSATYDPDPSLMRTISLSGRDLLIDILRNVMPGKDDYFENYSDKTNKFFYSTYLTPSDVAKSINVYPLYWRENRYGESDYLLGVYFHKWTGTGTGIVDEICFFDLDMDVKSCVEVNEGRWTSKDGKEAYMFGSVPRGTSFEGKFKGAHVEFDGFSGSTVESIGFYVKSGLKDTYTEGFGRDCEHISYTEARYNGMHWGDNFWNVKMREICNSYAGCVQHLSQSVLNAKHLDEFADGYNRFSVFGFNVQPDGIGEKNPDFSDCIIVVETGNMGQGRQLVHPGEKYKYFPWYLAAEDLGGSFDWDFNDVVVNIYDITTDYSQYLTQANGHYPVPNRSMRRVIVVPRASGGTLPVYLMYHGKVSPTGDVDGYVADFEKSFVEGDFIIGTEMHRWLGADDHAEPLNVSGNDMPWSGRAVSFAIPVDYPEDIDAHRPPQELGEDNTPMHGFWVMVDPKDNGRFYENVRFDPAGEGADTKTGFTPFAGTPGDGTYAVNAPNDDKSKVAPQMIMTFYNWCWPREMVDISTAWYLFGPWVRGEVDQWHPTGGVPETPHYDPEKVCNGPIPSWTE